MAGSPKCEADFGANPGGKSWRPKIGLFKNDSVLWTKISLFSSASVCVCVWLAGEKEEEGGRMFFNCNQMSLNSYLLYKYFQCF